MSKFKEYFSEPQQFNNNTYVIDGSFDLVEAALKISYMLGEEVNPNKLKRNRVRFGFAPEAVEDHERLEPCWYSGAFGKGSKGVWVYEN